MQDFLRFEEPGDPWHVGGQLNAAHVQPLWDLELDWESGGSTTIAELTQAQVYGSGAKTVDLTSSVWMIVVLKSNNTPYLFHEADYTNLDVITGNAIWCVLRRWLTAKTLDWQQS